jgi:hypothetical protein
MAGRRYGSVRVTRSLRGPPGAIVPLARNGRGLVLGMVLNIISRSLHAVVCRRKTAGLRDRPQPTNESTIPGGCQGLLAALNAAHRSLTRRPMSRPAAFTLKECHGATSTLPSAGTQPLFCRRLPGIGFLCGNFSTAQQRYDLTHALDEQLGLQPTRETRVMYRQILGQG